MSALPPHIIDALEELKDDEIEIASSNALKVRAWLYLLRFLSSFNYFYDKRTPTHQLNYRPNNQVYLHLE
jgi:beta-phosphoglucomutase-like phosphatase (HAD superfamily)